MQNSTAQTASEKAMRRDSVRMPDALRYAEALFFAYREFIAEPDRILKNYGFGRAHHRALFFVCRYPGLRVADLLDILQITKQSLSRVLRELVEKDYIEQQAGLEDKRERLLYATEKGTELMDRLAAPQIRRIEKGLQAAGAGGQEAVARFLDAMIGSAKDLPHKRMASPAYSDDEPPAGA